MDPITLTFRKLQAEHHRRSKHHPEHYAITLEGRMHLTCHMLGSCLARARESNLDFSISQLRAYIEHHQSKDWQYAVTENLPAPSAIVPDIPHYRRKNFKIAEVTRLLDPNDFYLTELESVQHQMWRHFNQMNAVREVHTRIVQDYDPRFSVIDERIQNYNLDLFRPDMLREYTLYFQRTNFKDDLDKHYVPRPFDRDLGAEEKNTNTPIYVN